MFTSPIPYHIVPPEDPDESDSEHLGGEKRPYLLHIAASRWSRISRWYKILGLGVLCAVTLLCSGWWIFQIGRAKGYQEGSSSVMQPMPPLTPPKISPPETTSGTHADRNNNCTHPSLRREWRSLSRQNKLAYLDAVNCLARTPSVLRGIGTVYDDFPWVHYQMAPHTHGKVAFLSWHRRFLHVYEQYLQELCGYRGSLPYWDWTLDWESLAQSPIFSTTTGFGGDGDPSLPETVGGGRCVTSGPLAGPLQPLFYGGTKKPHCLSRGFNFSDMPLEALSPDAVEKALQADTYMQFLLDIENGPHNAIPNAVRGDFYSFTAPYDPLSYLHHAQLDRLWLQWQRRDPATRFREYSGSKKGTSQASLQDSIWMGGLEHHGDVQVAQIMDPEGGELCYRYA
ncbi:Tyrosinase copper-binding domain-containing protein [Madurella fahalii]|uniref:Tyrosinase copper-binding domain-containing protein n=1 Tax=Madurella fahalii TaxID=1157608 RepID=A0ABQ0GAI5_9PEZI